MPTVKAAQSGGRRSPDPERTKADIIKAATREFSKRGHSGARIAAIAQRTATSTRMIYYYFGSKDGLYRAVLTNYYAQLRRAECNLRLEDHPPLEALTRLVHFTYDWHMSRAEGVRLVMAENVDSARHLAAVTSLEPVNSGIIATVERMLSQGCAEGVFRPDIDAMDLYLSIAALCFFSISNRSTIKQIFGYDMAAKTVAEDRRRLIARMVLRSVVADLSMLDPPARSPGRTSAARLDTDSLSLAY